MIAIRLPILAPYLLVVLISETWTFNMATARTGDNTDEHLDDVDKKFTEPALFKRSIDAVINRADAISKHASRRDISNSPSLQLMTGQAPKRSVITKRQTYPDLPYGWLNTERAKQWLGGAGGKIWLKTPQGRRWLFTSYADKWLLEHPGGKSFLATEDGKMWLDEEGGKAWFDDMLPSEGFLGRYYGRIWLHTPEGIAWKEAKDKQRRRRSYSRTEEYEDQVYEGQE